MKILLVSQYGIGMWHALRFVDEGHDVDTYIIKSYHEDILRGIAPEPLSKLPDFAAYDFVLFDLTGTPEIAEKSLLATPTMGDGNLATELEDNRLFGIQTMEQVGIEVPPYKFFEDLNAAKKFIKKSGKQFVFKADGDQASSVTYVSESAEDLLEYIDSLEEIAHNATFILQEVVKGGVELSIEGWFDGDDFYFVNGTLEEKKFMNDNKGPNTGCSGNLLWFFKNEPQAFTYGLSKMKDFLREAGFRGMIDLNSICTPTKLYGLEWTPRLGYDSSATIFQLIPEGKLAEFMYNVASGSVKYIDVSYGFAAGVRFSIPPYPSEMKGKHPRGIPIRGIEPEDLTNIYLYDAMIEKGKLVTTGVGFSDIGCVMNTGATIQEAFDKVYSRLKTIKVPNIQYRTDVCKSTMKRYNDLRAMGWI